MTVFKILEAISTNFTWSILDYFVPYMRYFASSKVSRSLVDQNSVRGGSATAATSKTERYVIIVREFLPLTIITKRLILDVAAVLDPPLSVGLTRQVVLELEYVFC